MNESENGGYKNLSNADRRFVEAGINRGFSFKRIADTLKRSPSTIAREVKLYSVSNFQMWNASF